MTESRYGREFGKGTLLGDKGDNFLSKPLEVQVYELGWSHACPVVPEVIEGYGGGENGQLLARQRYAETNFVYSLVVERARDSNPKLYLDLTRTQKRLPSEPVGRHYAELAPTNYPEEMSPMTRPANYAIPRAVIEEMGWGQHRQERNQERLLKALNLIDKCVSKSKDANELAVRLSEGACVLDANPEIVLSHLLPKELIDEENALTDYEKIFDLMKKHAPILREVYKGLSAERKRELGIIDFF